MGSNTTTPRGRTIADGMDEMRRAETTKARDRARCPQMDRVRGMSNHMCLNMDPGGKIDAVIWCVSCGDGGWGKRKRRAAMPRSSATRAPESAQRGAGLQTHTHCAWA